MSTHRNTQQGKNIVFESAAQRFVDELNAQNLPRVPGSDCARDFRPPDQYCTATTPQKGDSPPVGASGVSLSPT